MEFRTKVELPAKGPKIQHTDRLMIWGSCFSEHIGNLLAEHKFNCANISGTYWPNINSIAM